MKNVARFFSLVMVLSVLFTSCGGGKEKTPDEIRDSLLTEIKNLENGILKSREEGKLDLMVANKMVSLYSRFLKEFPEAQSAPDFLFKGADLYSNALQQPKEALAWYQKIIDKHQGFTRYPESLFLAGFTCQEKLANPVKAKEYYDVLIEIPRSPALRRRKTTYFLFWKI
jgi:tetratricopeptide (TPR) repeat protein